MDKILKLLEIAKKFGVKPSKVIGTQGNIVPLKKPSLVEVNVDEFKLKESIDSGAITMDKVQQEIEETVKLALSKNLNDVELNRALNNAVNIERQFFPPVADVVKFGSGEEIKGKGLEQLIKKQGTKNPPTTVAGQLETQGKKLEKAGEDLKEITEPKSVIGDIIKDYGDFDKYMQSSEKTGYVRATVRQIMREDIQAGKLKLPKELQDQVMQGIGEPIDVYRKVYGEGALEQIDSLADDLGKFRTEEEAAKFARSKYTIEPKAKPVDESKTYEELEDILKKGPNEPEGKAQGGIIGYAMGGRIDYETGGDVSEEQSLIEKILDGKIKIGAGFGNKNEDDPFNKYGFGEKDIKDPRLGIEYIMDPGNERSSKIGISVGPKGGGISFMKPFSEKLNEEKNEDVVQTYIDFARNVWGVEVTEQEARKALGIYDMPDTNIRNELPPEEIEEKAQGGRIGFNKGKRVLDLIAEANKKLKDKKSMESVNPKTGEVTVPKKPIRRAEEPTGMTTMDPEPEIIDEKSITKTKTKKKTIQRYDQDIIKAADEIYPSYDDPKIAADQIVDSYAQMKFGLEDQYGLSNKERMDLYTQAYDYVMDYNRGAIGKTTNEFNISDPKTAEAFTNFARENDPEGFKKIQKIVDDINNKNALEEFDIKDREPNANGGIAGLL